MANFINIEGRLVNLDSIAIADWRDDGKLRLYFRNCELDYAVFGGPDAERAYRYLLKNSVATGDEPATYQQGVARWARACFGDEIAADKVERNHRFIEEAMELAQSLGMAHADCLAIADYVFGRPQGNPGQEVGGVMTTLAALCNANGLDMTAEAEKELARVWTKIETIRAKQKAKPHGSPLPA